MLVRMSWAEIFILLYDSFNGISLCSKSISLDGTFAPAWIGNGNGNAYAAKEESDQAMLAFRTVARLFPG